ncbi:MAG: RHS repeat-associated core domain-containing protein [Phycisphaerales bacterium]
MDAPNGSSGGNGAKHHPFDYDYDSGGNVRFDGRFYYQYDGMNRLKDVFDVNWTGTLADTPMQGNRRAHFDYDGPGQLVKSSYRTHVPSTSGDLSNEDIEWTPRDLLGRPLGIWRQKPATGGGDRPCAKPYQGFGYHNTGFRGEGADDTRGILDCPAIRWRDTDGDGVFDEKLSYLQDFRGDIQALMHEKYGVQERVRYGPTGYPESFPASDVNFDGIVDATDLQNMQDAVKAFGNDHTKYDPRADLNRDGKVDSDDEGLFNDNYSKYSKYEGMWKLSSGPGLLYNINGDNAGLDNRFGWRGYWYDPHLQQYHVRNRVYDPRPGAWKQNDPLGFSAGDQNLYRYADGNYSTGYDPLGLDPDDAHGFWWYLAHPRGQQPAYEVHPALNGNDIANIRGGAQIGNQQSGIAGRMEQAERRGAEDLSLAFQQRFGAMPNALQQPLNVALVYTVGTVVVTTVFAGSLEDLAVAGAIKVLGTGIKAITRVGTKWIAESINGAKYELKAEEAAALEAKIAQQEAREVAGAGRGKTPVNPHSGPAGEMNCGNSALALDARLKGAKDLQALPNPDGVGWKAWGELAEKNEWTRDPNAVFATEAELTAAIAARGEGKQAIIWGVARNGRVHHLFNGVQRGGEVKLLNGQEGILQNTSTFKGYYVWWTN